MPILSLGLKLFEISGLCPTLQSGPFLNYLFLTILALPLFQILIDHFPASGLLSTWKNLPFGHGRISYPLGLSFRVKLTGHSDNLQLRGCRLPFFPIMPFVYFVILPQFFFFTY